MNLTHHLSIRAADTDELEPVTPAEILRGAARYLEIHGWITRHYYSNAATSFPPACVVGAIGMAAHGRMQASPQMSGSNARDCNKAVIYLTGHLVDLGDIDLCPDDYATTPASLFDWNDHDGQSAESVITTLRAAADEYDWAHATEDDLETYADVCAWAEKTPDRDSFLTWLKARR